MAPPTWEVAKAFLGLAFKSLFTLWMVCLRKIFRECLANSVYLEEEGIGDEETDSWKP